MSKPTIHTVRSMAKLAVATDDKFMRELARKLYWEVAI